jgi:hypothetical protein
MYGAQAAYILTKYASDIANHTSGYTAAHIKAAAKNLSLKYRKVKVSAICQTVAENVLHGNVAHGVGAMSSAAVPSARA